jgi:hypothetical protein
MAQKSRFLQERTCDDLINSHEVATAAADSERVERSDGAPLEAGWSFVDEQFGLEDITCLEGFAVPKPVCNGTRSGEYWCMSIRI